MQCSLSETITTFQLARRARDKLLRTSAHTCHIFACKCRVHEINYIKKKVYLFVQSTEKKYDKRGEQMHFMYSEINSTVSLFLHQSTYWDTGPSLLHTESDFIHHIALCAQQKQSLVASHKEHGTFIRLLQNIESLHAHTQLPLFNQDPSYAASLWCWKPMQASTKSAIKWRFICPFGRYCCMGMCRTCVRLRVQSFISQN